MIEWYFQFCFPLFFCQVRFFLLFRSYFNVKASMNPSSNPIRQNMSFLLHFQIFTVYYFQHFEEGTKVFLCSTFELSITKHCMKSKINNQPLNITIMCHDMLQKLCPIGTSPLSLLQREDYYIKHFGLIFALLTLPSFQVAYSTSHPCFVLTVLSLYTQLWDVCWSSCFTSRQCVALQGLHLQYKVFKKRRARPELPFQKLEPSGDHRQHRFYPSHCYLNILKY